MASVPATAPLPQVVSPAERLVMRRVTLRLIPFLFVVYLFALIDRVNVGFAALHMNHDLHLSASAYGFGAGVFFVGYALCELPSNLVLYRVGARTWLARIMITWGLLSSAMIFVRGPISFYALRFLLGAAEAGLFPGVIYYLSRWFPPEERARAVARFMTAIPWAYVVGGPLAGALLSLDGRSRLAGWQWLFLIEGIPALLLGLIIPFVLTERPEEARWLTGDERIWLVARIRRAEAHLATSDHGALGEVLRTPIVWILGVVYSLGMAGSYGLTLWLPELVKGYSGRSDMIVGLITALPYLVAGLGMVVVGAHSDRTGERVLHVVALGIVSGLAFFASAFLHSPVLAMSALTVAATANLSRNGPFWALPSMFVAGRGAAAAIALIASVGSVGAFAGPYVVGLARDLTGSFSGGLFALGLLQVASALIVAPLARSPILAVSRREPR